MARSGSTQRQDPTRRPKETGGAGGGRTAGLERALYLTVLLDVAVAALQLYVHARLAGSQGAYTSFCNVSAEVNCDAVLGSRFSTLLGVPLEALALAKDVAVVALLRWRGARARTRSRASLLLVALTVWSTAFSVYLAAVASLVLGVVCLLCAVMYVLNPLQAVLAWRLARADAGRGRWLTVPQALLGAGGIAGALAAVAALQLPTPSASLAAIDPEFADWFADRPVVDRLPPARHSKGPDDARLTIVEFSDFECVYCARAFRDLREFQRRHPDDVRIVFHHFPLSSDCNPLVRGRMHRFACEAAAAAECAERFGQFWAYHDVLFEAQDRLNRDALIESAEALGIDRGAFITCLDDPAVRARIRQDVAAGGDLGVESTPTLFINGRAVPGALDARAYEYVLAMERRS